MQFMCSLTLLFSTSDPLRSNIITPEIEGMQCLLMKLFFENITDEGKRNLGARSDIKNVCHPTDYLRWMGVYLENEAVDYVTYNNLDIGNFNIHALPHTTKQVYIDKCRQKYSIETRMLPRKLFHLSAYENQIYGTIDLTNLPPLLQVFLVLENVISGPIILTHLPPHLKLLNLSFNKISQKVVLYGNLPKHIERISLGDQYPKPIGGVRAISPHDELSGEVVKKVFKGMSHISKGKS